MNDETEGEISVRGSPDLTAEFFYVIRGLTVVATCQKHLEQGPTLEERRRAAREGSEALASVRDSLQRIPELVKRSELPPEACAMFTQTLAGQQQLFDAAEARFKAALLAHGLPNYSG
jgi:hypothetical protein